MLTNLAQVLHRQGAHCSAVSYRLPLRSPRRWPERWLSTGELAHHDGAHAPEPIGSVVVGQVGSMALNAEVSGMPSLQVRPPSIGNSTPLTYSASSEAR